MVTWRARCSVMGTPGSGNGLGKRAGRNPGTAPQADFTKVSRWPPGHAEDGRWLGSLRDELQALLAALFCQARSRLTAFAYLDALLAEPGDRRAGSSPRPRDTRAR